MMTRTPHRWIRYDTVIIDAGSTRPDGSVTPTPRYLSRVRPRWRGLTPPAGPVDPITSSSSRNPGAPSIPPTSKRSQQPGSATSTPNQRSPGQLTPERSSSRCPAPLPELFPSPQRSPPHGHETVSVRPRDVRKPSQPAETLQPNGIRTRAPTLREGSTTSTTCFPVPPSCGWTRSSYLLVLPSTAT